ncbi:aspartic proteinase Asp1-like [Rhodamnia argentea]|uniref:Aspartic proteinase Asp1-like n=1 Tax=Rhodamnia argentea TaxID=178133 RepID=A0A8B8N1S8_9MYRT|nr:aspartic proteinase Asp1-like [Rhodamnia argentea]
MRKEKVGLVALVIIVSSWCVSPASSSSSRGEMSRGKAPVTFGSPSSSLALNRVGSSVVFSLHGNVFPTGSYNTTIFVGQPPKPYFVDPDTGSDLTWLQCDAPCRRCTQTPHPLYRPNSDLVICRDPICASLHSGDYKCDHPEQCDYEVEYADGGSSLGVLVKDDFSFESYGGGFLSARVALGCGYDQIPGRSNPFLDGVLGLGKGKSSIVSQLSSQGLVPNVLGHCLSARGGGFLFFGDDLYDSSRIMWTPMSRDYLEHYSPGTAELLFAGKATGLKNLLLVVDSGSSYTYFSSQAYQAFAFAVKKELNGKPFTEALDDPTLPLCWKGRKPFKNIRDVRKYFKPFALSFNSGGRTKNQFEVPPESYLIISSKGNVCMGVLNGTEAGLQNMNVIGDISMQDKMVIYDNERQLIGWAAADCSRNPKSRATVA